MPKLIPISARKLIKIIKILGFIEIRSKGSHHFFLNPNSKKTTTIPVHSGEDISTGTLKSILHDINISMDEYEKLRKES